ncbi:acetyltransferase [Patellaria atrata CBS 101060]|uniref:Acetyltransferase n=1 Tax=Patellaria atrata CBS 101060 TaxID=1346257 RepID=A0A9P4VV38_9PEZI|nr:acetyltransferase [Patellaria atrata CBS 101060]
MPESPSIRHATHEDIPEVLAMINELAGFENALHEVKATEASLSRTLSFAPESSSSFHEDDKPNHLPERGYARALILVDPDMRVAGMALYFYNYSTWRAAPGIYLEDLFVRPEYRKKGYGGLLIRELAKQVVGLNGGRLEWACLKWNENALNFYRGLGAKTMDEWVGLRVDGDALIKLAESEP